MSKGWTLHRTYRLLCFVFALSWVVQRDMCGEVFFSCAREYVFVLEENEGECQLVSGDRSLYVIELGLCCQWLKAPVFQAESLPHLHAQGFPPSFSGFLICL